MVCVAVFSATPILLALVAAKTEYQAMAPVRQAVVRPSDADALALESVRLTSSSGDSVRGWYVPSTTGAAVVLVHGSGADRSQMLAAARIFRGVGIGSLLLDAPGSGESGGRSNFGDAEREALTAGVQFLSRRPEIDSSRVGVYGFSAGAINALRLASDPRLRAFALASCPTDLRSVTNREYAGAGILAQWAAAAVLRRRGVELDREQPIEIIERVHDRPLLLVSGAADSLVPPSDAARLAGAMPSATLLQVPDLGHVEPMSHSTLAAARILEFFKNALKER